MKNREGRVILGFKILFNAKSKIYNILQFFLQYILPRLVFAPYVIAKFIASILLILPFTNRLFKRPRSVRGVNTRLLTIESGPLGWRLIEYKEIYQSAVEYIGEAQVEKLVLHKDRSYLSQVKSYLREKRPSHYAYSPRTAGQTLYTGLRDAFGVLCLITVYEVTPIVFLTDLPHRRWRAQAAVVSAINGLVVSLMSPREIAPIFPHSRIIGPCIMPFSTRTLMHLERLKAHAPDSEPRYPTFAGALYEPRASKLKYLQLQLRKHGIEFLVKGRAANGERIPDYEYWFHFISAPIVFTTADQVSDKGTDWAYLPHFLYRYTEVLAAGSLLLAPHVPGVARYFQPGIHFVEYRNLDEAVCKIRYYMRHAREREQIAKSGHSRVSDLTRANAFWLGIDIALGLSSLT